MDNNDFCDLDAMQRGNGGRKEGGGRKALFFGGVVVGMAGALLILCAVYLGVRIQGLSDLRQNGAEANGVLFTEDSAVSPEVVRKLQRLELTVDEYFYLREVSDEELANGMYRGLLNALGDPYSEYYTAEELKDLMDQSQGIYYGIGAYVELDKSTTLPKINGVIAGSPAEEAQLRANDLIYEVNGNATYGLSLTEAVALIKGEEGTEVSLTIIREGESDYLTIPVTRRKVEAVTVEYEMLENQMAYIQITEFDDVTVAQFEEAMTAMRNAGMEGLILDLRANPGGNLSAVVDICRNMLPQGLIVYTEDKYGEREEYKCDGKNQLEVPLVTLIDMNSASASEIMAGAIQDYGIGTLVGTTTFGKGIVQQILPFADGSAVKVTISSYFTPNGRDIHGVGISPDVECAFDGEAYYNRETPYDNQLEKAKEVLLEKMGGQ